MAARSLYFQVSGTEDLIKTLGRLKAAAPVALAEALREEAEAVIDYADAKYLPVDQGGLRTSHFVKPVVLTPIGATVVLGYGGASAPYAAAVHENPRAGKTGGVSPSGRRYRHWAKVGEWQFLEKALVDRSRRFAQRVGARIRRDWARLLP